VTGDYAVRIRWRSLSYQVRQVFLNVLRNAMEAMPNGGQSGITMLLADNFLVFKVTDTGTGIPKESLEHSLTCSLRPNRRGPGWDLRSAERSCAITAGTSRSTAS